MYGEENQKINCFNCWDDDDTGLSIVHVTLEKNYNFHEWDSRNENPTE